ncbi:MAG TPA: hypothetical protein VM122_09670 [Usitatibacter sp.]|nr:hypothetical protein [Usitatibacter sp.]
MKITPRAKLLLLAALFLAPIVASSLTYYLARPGATSNYGELLLPPAQAPAHAFLRDGGGRFAFAELAGQWAMVASDSGACDAACMEKLKAMHLVRLALGRRASRVARVLVVEDPRTPAGVEAFEGMIVARAQPGVSLPAGIAHDRAHIYLVDPHGNVMMRWPAAPDMKRMLRDLERVLRASQIG